MKLSSRQVRFDNRTAVPWRRQLQFIGKQNSIQLLETAMVIEGSLKRLSFPFTDWLFEGILSERTTVTIPYSRIERFRLTRLLIRRILASGLFSLAGFAGFIGMVGAYQQFSLSKEVVLLGLLLLASGLGVFHVNRILWPPRYHLLFRPLEGRSILIRFTVRSRQLRETFGAELEANRRAALSMSRARRKRMKRDSKFLRGLADECDRGGEP